MRTSTPFLSVLLAAGAAAQTQTYVEDFTTSTFQDFANTEVDWNTTDGELRLHELPVSLGSSISAVTQDLDVQGDLLYVAASNEFMIVDVSDPTNLVEVSSFPGFPPKAVCVEGDLAYLADSGDFLRVFDVSDAASPFIAANVALPDGARSMSVDGDWALIGTSGQTVLVDVTDPSSPVLYDLDAQDAADVALRGDLAVSVHVDAPDEELRFFDVSDLSSLPLAPLGSFAVPSPTEVVVLGDVAYVGTEASGLWLLDVTDPANVSLLSTVGAVTAHGVDVFGDRVVVVGGGEASIVGVLISSSPSIQETITGLDSSAREVRVHGGVAWLGGNQVEGLRIAAPVAPTTVLSVAANARDAVVASDLVYVAATGLQIRQRFPLGNLVGSYPTSTPSGLDVAGDHAYLCLGATGLRIVDVSDPTTPTLASTYDTSGTALDVAVAGNHAFVADGAGQFTVVDVSDPTSPQLASTFSTVGSGLVQGVALQGNLAYLATGSRGLQIVDIEDPANPTAVGDVTTGGAEARDVDVAGDYAFVAYGTGGLRVYDVSDPTSPTVVNTTNTPDEAHGVEVSGDLLVLANGSAGVLTYDITDPANPSPVGTLDTAGTALAATLDGRRAFLADSTSVQVVTVRQEDTDWFRSEGRSTAIDDETNDIVRARLSSTSTTGLSWELSSDAGTTWTAVASNGTWTALDPVGAELVWRSTHVQLPAKPNPTATDLTIDWRTDSAFLTDVSDVPGDGGGWVRLSFNNSGYDFADETDLPVTGYQVYRLVESTDSLAPVGGGTGARAPLTPALQSLGDRVQQVGNRFFVQGSTGSEAFATTTFPPGTWELLSFHAATQQESYIAVAPTIADGVETEFLLTTHTTTPSVWFVSDSLSGMSVGPPPTVPQWQPLLPTAP